MAITVAPKGEAARAALAGKIIGGAQAAQRQIEQTQRIQEQLRSIAAQKEMTEFNYQLALEKAKFNATMDLEAEKRARTWEIEKMELRSRIDFEEEERKRIKEEEEYEVGVRMILENDNLTEERKADALNQFQMRKLAGYVPPEIGTREREEREERGPFTALNIQRGLGALTTGAPTSPMGFPMEVLKSREDFETYATNQWGPYWRSLVPEAVELIENKLRPHGEKILTQEMMHSYAIAAEMNIEKAKELARKDGYRVD